MSCSISVAVRLRCFNSREKNYKAKLCVDMPDANTVSMLDPKASVTNAIPPRKFQFDHAFWSFDQPEEGSEERKFADQQHVYECVGKPVLENALKGFNGCIFAYGQTGSGKSYSMSGSAEDPGVIPRLCEDLFKHTSALEDTSVAIDCSYLEIYNEQVKDLLNPAGLDKALKVRQHPKLGVFVEGLKKMSARSAEDIAKYVDDGQQVRTIASTNMNATSSRSHAIMTLSVRVKSLETETMATLHLVDLAGSERQASTGAEGQTLKEGANINKSLSVLGMCLSRLAEVSDKPNRSAGHIPFRDSSLTWLLHDALGGNSKTTMLAAISPADINFEETLSTLRFASITKKIKMVVKVNEDPQQKIIRELREQIQQIKEDIKALAEGRILKRPSSYDDGEEDEGGVDAMSVDALPDKADLDVRRAQLLEELEENTNLMTEWTMTDEQRAEKDEAERVAHEKQMAELTKGSRGVGSTVDETSPKLLVLNEDLRTLRGADGNPMALVHTMVRPPKDEAPSEGESPDRTDNESPQQQRARAPSLIQSRSRSYAAGVPPAAFTVLGPKDTHINLDDDDDLCGGIEPWLRLPSASGLSTRMRLDFIVDYQNKTMALEFFDGASPNSGSQNSGDVVFVNGKPFRVIASAASDKVCAVGNDRCVSLSHNDRVIIGQVVFRVFEPLAWRAERESGEEETFQVEATDTAHLQMLESYERLSIEEAAFEQFTLALFGDDSEERHEDDAGLPAGAAAAAARGAAGSAAFVLQTSLNAAQDDPVTVNAAEVRSNLEALASTARFARADAEELLIQEYPRDVKRELRAGDVQDALSFDGAFAIKERTEYIQTKQREQEEVQKKLKDLEAEGEILKKQVEEREREREAAAKKAADDADRAAQEQVKKAEAMAAEKRAAAAKGKGGAGGAGDAGAMTVAGMKQTAQGKLAIARRVHEYEELRRELLLWKPAGPTDPRDRPTYTSLCELVTAGKNLPTYIQLRQMFGSGGGGDDDSKNDDNDVVLPRFEGQVFKNRIKTGFFSRGGLHPQTLIVLHHFLFYLEPGAALQPAEAANKKMTGFAYVVGCETEVIADIEKKPALRVVSCAPRKVGQGKTDAHHPLEFAFASIEQREAMVRAVDAVRLPAPDQEVAAALAQLES